MSDPSEVSSDEYDKKDTGFDLNELEDETESNGFVEDGDKSNFEDLDAYSDELSDIGLSDINPQYADEDISDVTISDNPNVEIPDIFGVTSEKINLPPTSDMDTNDRSKWASNVDPRLMIDNIHELISNPAIEFDFELDNFQKQSILCMEKDYSIFVAAHTSSGKTVVAEYAIAMALREKMGVIYTSPIKTLSNQSYRSFKQKFENVGILTGDVQKDPDASCIIMTTEILRDILYKRTEKLDNVKFVIFDEVHYINDQCRGVVWEEVIILLPAHINIIMLTATVSNALEFAEWVGKTKRKPFRVICTMKRPIPLEHYIYCSKKLYKIVDNNGKFLDNNWKEANNDLKNEAQFIPEKFKTRTKVSGPNSNATKTNNIPDQKTLQKNSQDEAAQKRQRIRDRKMENIKKDLSKYYKSNASAGANSNSGLMSFLYIFKILVKQKYLPVIFFTFSKKRCNAYAKNSKIDFHLNDKQKNVVRSFITKALSRLKEQDRRLPQIMNVKNLLMKGIAIHHGGLLPIVKEIVEILFSRGFVKCLFATETFAMGVNSPARCIVFSEYNKHDGTDFRDINPGEYTQMSGRAGRRGMDTFGIVIINMNNNLPIASDIKKLILGKPKKLMSQFYLTYNMVLNLLRIESLDIDHIISRSFSEYESSVQFGNDITEYQNENKATKLIECNICDKHFSIIYELSKKIERAQHEIIINLIYKGLLQLALPMGRIVLINNGKYENNLAILTAPPIKNMYGNAYCTSDKNYDPHADVRMKYKIKAMVAIEVNFSDSEVEKNILPHGLIMIPNKNVIKFIEDDQLELSDISIITDLRMPGFPQKHINKMGSSMNRHTLATALSNAADMLRGKSQFNNFYVISKDYDYAHLISIQIKAVAEILDNPSLACPNFSEHYTSYHSHRSLIDGLEALKLSSSKVYTVLHQDNEKRMNVLRELGFLDASDIVTLKGRVAIEIRSTSPLILTEIILENIFANCEPEEIAAVLSVLVNSNKSASNEKVPSIDDKLIDMFKDMMVIINRVAEIEKKYEVIEDVNQYMQSFKTEMIGLTYKWLKQVPFVEIMTTTTIMEGVIVRTMISLDEACREVLDAAKCFGNTDLVSKMEKAIQLVRRDIAFSASLYL